MNFIFKHLFKKDKNALSQKGQGTLEYILMLFVIVAVIMGFLWQFNDAFGKWSKNYFSEYIACLIEYGELPSLGGGERLEGCDSAYVDFDLASGRNPVGSPIGSGNQDESKKNRSNAEGGGEGRTTADSSGGGRNMFSSGRSGNLSGAGSLRGGRFSGGGGDDETSGEDLFGGNSRGKTSLDGPKETVMRPRQIYYTAGDFKEDKKKKADKKPQVAKTEENVNRPARLTVRERSVRKTAAMEDSGVDLGLGGLIRFLFIMGIIIAIIILLGSQALQISKEWD